MIQSKKIKIIFVLPELGGGGAERVMVNLLRNLDRNIFEIIFIVGKKEGPYLHLLPSDIEVIALNRNRTLSMLPDLVKLIRKIKPDIVFSTLTRMNVITIIAKILSGLRTKVIIREVNTFSIVQRNAKGAREKFLPLLVRLLYNRADIMVFPSKGALEDFHNYFKKMDSRKMQVIYNPLEIDKILELKSEKIDEPFWENNEKRKIISVGRLERQKGHKFLFDAISIVNQELGSVELIILGKGKEEEALREYAEKIGILNNVKFMGFKANPYKYIAHSDVFVLSSLWEGFANVITEAMACGTPVVATDCPSGPREIINNGVNGVLVPVANPKAMASSIISILQNDHLANLLRENGFKRALDFDVKKIVKEYEELFLSLLCGKL